MPARKLPFFTRLRFATSVIATWVLNANMFGFSLEKLIGWPERTLKSYCSPGFNCHGCPWSTMACPVGVITYGASVHTLPVMAIASVLAIGVILGRLACSFLCPFGLLQDVLYRIPSPKITLPRYFRYGKYLALALLVFILPYLLGWTHSGYIAVQKPVVNKADDGNISVKVAVRNISTEPINSPHIILTYAEHETKKELLRQEKDFPGVDVPPGATVELPEFQIPNRLSEADLVLDSPQSRVDKGPKFDLYYCRLCPAGTLTATIPAYFADGQTTPMYSRMSGHVLRLSILALFLVLMVIAARPFCRLFCPLGAMYALTTRLSVVSMAIDSNVCTGCNACSRVCPVDLDVVKEIGGPDCIACGDCQKACPQSGIRRTIGL